MGMMKEFKEFIITGNVIDFAVGVILAAAVGLVVNGFVNDIIMPIIGEVVGGSDFSQLKHVLSAAEGVEGEDGFKAENAIRWGSWVNTIINLLIVGFVLFMIVKSYNKVKAPEPEAGPSDNDLLMEIRDALKK